MALTLYLVRHGETEENVAHLLQGHLPGHLTPEGRRQARTVRDALASTHFDALMCSDLLRCLDTAAIVNEPHGLPLEPTELLRERDWGIHTGCAIRTVAGGVDASAETVEAMYARARRFLHDLVRRHDGQTVLAVSHGLFSRVVQGAYLGRPIREILRMDNAEVRILEIETPLHLKDIFAEESGYTAN